MKPDGSSSPRIDLVIADVDGTLVSHEKVLTPRAKAAVAALRSSGIRFAITSGRPPRGMKMVIDDLELDTPVAGFNGGLFVSPDLDVIAAHKLEAKTVRRTLEVLDEHGVTAWLYTDTDWYVPDADGPHVARETWTVKYGPKVATDYNGLVDRTVKVVGVSDDADAMRTCVAAMKKALGGGASAELSQPYYLDVTSEAATKGAVVDYLSSKLKVPRERIASIGDMPNDVSMFRRTGLSIAMGNASDAVKAKADVTTTDCDHDGFADAMERFVLTATMLRGAGPTVGGVGVASAPASGKGSSPVDGGPPTIGKGDAA